MTSRKKPGVAFWATVVVVVIALYVASLGPACWLTDRQALPHGPADWIYRPLVSMGVFTHCNGALEWYGTLVELPELPGDPEAGTDCRLYTAVRIRLDAE
jgi:hypothetical protein